jgi:MoxR-like ATPase
MAKSIDTLRHVSASPTLPRSGPPREATFDVQDLYQGPAGSQVGDGGATTALDDKLRQAYFWIVNHAIITPFYDLHFDDGAPRSFHFGGVGTTVRLPTDQSYSSFALLPLLTFVARKRALLVGGPGRGKTATAVLMGLLAGYDLPTLHRAIQHGQPQMTVSDLLGSPLPKSLVTADDQGDIRIAWREWIRMRVKIVDEYNRIPTRTQSALLTLLGDGYAEVMGQVVESPESAWFLTANDDLGGGTYQVIEALKDRVDVTIKALDFNPRFLGDLLTRIEDRIQPEKLMPRELIFSEAELDEAYRQILAVSIPLPVRRRFEFFASQFGFCDLAATEIEYKTKDTIKLAGRTLSAVCATDCGRDKAKCLCSQTENGLSVRALMTALTFAKSMAWFRGRQAVGLDDLRQILPWVLHEKLVQNPTSAFFDQEGRDVLRIDRIAWLRQAFIDSCAEYDRLDLDRNDPLAEVDAAFAKGLDGLDDKAVRTELDRIELLLGKLAQNTKLYAHVAADVLKLKYYHQRYSNYLRWWQWKRGA